MLEARGATLIRKNPNAKVRGYMTKRNLKLVPAAAAACLALLSLSGTAQQRTATGSGTPALTARVDPPAGAQPASGSSATSTDTSQTTPAANGAQPADVSQISNAELMKD